MPLTTFDDEYSQWFEQVSESEDYPHIEEAAWPAAANEITRHISSLRLVIDHLEDEIEQIAKEHAPISRLPPELLARVFEAGTGLLPQASIAMTFAAVSRAWRAIALRTPSLWSTIQVDHNLYHDSETDDIPEAQQYRILTFCKRSGVTPLTIHAQLPIGCCRGKIPRLAALLRSQMPRCRSLVVIAGEEAFQAFLTPELWELAQGQTNHIKQMTLANSSGEWESLHTLFVDGRFPRLHKLTLSAFSPSMINPSAIPSLETLVLNEVEHGWGTNGNGVLLPEFVRFLGGLPNLRSLVVHGCKFALRSAASLITHPFSVPLNSLRRLSVKDITAQELAVLMEVALFPQLLHLSLEVSGSSSDVFSFPCWGSSRLSSLQSLCLKDVTMEGIAGLFLLRALRHLPALTRLLLVRTDIDSGFYSALAAPPWIMPRLTELIFKRCSEVTADELISLVRARGLASNVASITRMEIRKCAEDDQLIVLQLQGIVTHLVYEESD